MLRGYPYPLYANPIFTDARAELEPQPASGRLGSTSQPFWCCPVAETACREAVWFTQSLLLSSRKEVADIVAAVRKIKAHVDELRP